MSTKNEESKPSNNVELPKQEALACGPGCGCHAAGPSSPIRRIIGVIALVAAAGLVARAMLKNNGRPADAATPGYAALPTTTETPPPTSEDAKAVKEIAALSELNTVAVDTDAVFVFLPRKDDAPGAMPIAPIQGAVRTIESRANSKVGIFALNASAPEYAQLAMQVAVPGVIAMVKGRGMSAVSGEITEAKLVQAFVGESRTGGRRGFNLRPQDGGRVRGPVPWRRCCGLFVAL